MAVRTIVERINRRRTRAAPEFRDRIAELVAEIDELDPRVGEAIRQRVTEIVRALTGVQVDREDTSTAVTSLIRSLTPMYGAGAWLLLATIDGQLPSMGRVEAVVRSAELDGTDGAVIDAISSRMHEPDAPQSWLTVRILAERKLVDVQHTSRADFATGIQRVTREVTRRWFETQNVVLVGWRDDLSAMRALTPNESHRARWGGPPVEIPDDDPIIVPWRCTYILPELAAEVVRAAHLQTMAMHSGSTLNMIGYDLVPITTAETSHEGLVPGFARNLAAAKYARVIVPISAAAAEEYRGWRAMLAGTGLAGPRIESVLLPNQAPPENPAATAAARARLQVGVLPLVLVVGSHEPRKNHLAVLHAAELLWREGQLFSLSFIGGNSWNSETFTETLAGLQAIGRPVEAVSAASDDILWGGYRVARFTIFPSLNEGYGLPVAESLSCGTPVVTSNFGSMKEIADAGGGAVLVDPRNDHSIADGMRSLLIDDELRARLAREARSRPPRTWDTYASETWELLTGL